MKPYLYMAFTSAYNTAPDALVDNLVIWGNEDTVSGCFSELLASGLDELLITLLPVINANEEQTRFLQLVARLWNGATNAVESYMAEIYWHHYFYDENDIGWFTRYD